MNTTIMSADDLIRYAKPQTDLESALMDALAEALDSVNELADILSILADHDMTPQTMDKDLTDAKNRFDALVERYEALEEKCL